MENTFALELIDIDRRLTEYSYEKLTDGQLSHDVFVDIIGRLRIWSEIGYGIVGILQPSNGIQERT